MKSYGLNIQMKTTKQYFPVVLLMMLFKVVLTFKSVDDSNWAVLSCGTVYYAAQSGSCFWWSMKSHVVAVQMKPTDQKGGGGWEILTNTPKTLLVTKRFLKSYSGLSMQYASSSWYLGRSSLHKLKSPFKTHQMKQAWSQTPQWLW